MTSLADFVVFSMALACSILGLYSYDYCHMEDGCNHVACDSPELTSKRSQRMATKNFTNVVMSRKMREAILHAHNLKRNEIACGKIKDSKGVNFPSAGRMREVAWDNELEYLARRHSEKCIFAHDECRIASAFKNLGQNIAMKMSTGGLPSPISDAEYFVNAWFEEYKDASVDEVDSVGSTKTDAKIGHFTVMVNERVRKVGCGMTRCFLGPSKTMHLFTCDYSYANMQKLRLYRKNEQAASRCVEIDAVRSLKYDCLCANNDYEIKD